MKFLYCVYAFNKNYEYIGKKEEENNSDDDSDDSKQDSCCSDDEDSESKMYRTFTYDYLIKQILENCEDEASQRIKQVADWKL